MAVMQLTAHEIFHAALVGVTRQIDNLRNHRLDRYGASTEEGWRLHIEGACGELAVARYFDRYWSGNLGNLQAPDVGAFQVRTRPRPDGNLILHPSDADDEEFVLVTGTAPRFELRGWIRGAEGKRQEFWKDPAGGRPAFFVPASALHPMEALA